MDVAADGLDAGGAIDVGDGGQEVARGGEDVDDTEHEGAFAAKVEEVGGALGEDRGSEGAEGLAVLDAGVEVVLHAGIAGVGEQAAEAERARTELGAGLEPGDDVAGGEEARGGFGGVREVSHGQAAGAEGGFDVGVGVRGAEAVGGAEAARWRRRLGPDQGSARPRGRRRASGRDRRRWA